MAAYYWGNEGAEGKLLSAEWDVRMKDGELYGCIQLKRTEPLTEVESVALKEWITGQNSDGWGEGFEQRLLKLRTADCTFLSGTTGMITFSMTGRSWMEYSYKRAGQETVFYKETINEKLLSIQKKKGWKAAGEGCIGAGQAASVLWMPNVQVHRKGMVWHCKYRQSSERWKLSKGARQQENKHVNFLQKEL